MKNIISILEERGFIDNMTNQNIRQIVEKPIKIYAGFDPTADSLHLGNLVAIIGLGWFQKYGHTPIAIVGGATGMVGDPSGKSVERNLLDKETLEKNLTGIKKNLTDILHFGSKDPIIMNNYDWFENYSFINFLRDIGKYFRMGVMLSKDSVRSRLNSEAGLSFTEFSYQLLQSYDFLHLAEEEDVALQIGGSDQWGNIVAGTELIRKKGCTKTAEGLTFPLITRSDGKKFGKSESGTIWLSPEKKSPYDFYQYLVRISDADVIKLMKLLTFMDMEEIRKYEKMLQSEDYIPNTAQKKLAQEVTEMVHGSEGLKTALKATQVAAPGSSTILDADTLESISNDIPSCELSLDEVVGCRFSEVSATAGIVSSRGEARRLIKNNGAYINNKNVQDEHRKISSDDLIDGRLILLGAGKKKKMIIKIK